MNMKDAFRFQNKLQTLMGTAQDILSSSRNITKVENTYLRKKVMPEAEDEVTVDQPTSEYSEQITCVTEFLLYLMTEKEKLGAAIYRQRPLSTCRLVSTARLDSTAHVRNWPVCSAA